MKRQWTPEELVEQFTLSEDEITLLPQKNEANRLGFAVLLKFFQINARFPQSRRETPQPIVSYLAQQLHVSPKCYRDYDWHGRTIERHRAEIRTLLEFQETTLADMDRLKQWLCDKVIVFEYQKAQVLAAAYEYLREAKLEPPTPGRLKRLVRSAIRDTEKAICEAITQKFSARTCQKLDALLDTERSDGNRKEQFKQSAFNFLKADPGRISLKSLLTEIEKLQSIRHLKLPPDLFSMVPPKVTTYYRRRASVETPRELRRHPNSIRYTLVAAFCWQRSQEITDSLVDLLIGIIHRINVSAERRVEKELIEDFKKVNNKSRLLFEIAEASLESPEGPVKDVVYPVVSPTTLKAVIKEYKSSGVTYHTKVYTLMRSSYVHHYRRMVPQILDTLEFRSNNPSHHPVISALELLKQYRDSHQRYYDSASKIVITGVIKKDLQDVVIETDTDGNQRVNRVNYELCVLQALRERLRSKAIWVAGAKRYCNPEEDLPQNFDTHRDTYYQAIKQPLDAETFIQSLKTDMTAALTQLEQGLPKNDAVRILKKHRGHNGWISLTPLDKQPDPPNLARLKREVDQRWPMTSLLDVLKETDLRVQFTDLFQHVGGRENMDRTILQRRLLLCLYGMGSNTGMKRVCAGIESDSEKDLRYVKRHYIHREYLRNAIAQVVNAVFRVRKDAIWGAGSTTCASDAKKFGAWDQNLMTEWHVRYGGRGVMIYWHVEKKSVCIYSQLKTCSSSEVAAMMEGLLRHCTDMKVERNYVDTHGQSEIAFAFCHLLGFNLMPRIKGIGKQRLYLPDTGQKATYPNLELVLSRPINWELIRQQYDQMIKYATALRLGTAEAEIILKRFNRSSGPQHPTHKALLELGKAVKTIFLCQYLRSEEIRREIQEGLNVVEQWNGANDFIYFGRSGEMTSNRLEHQELSMLCLHLLQISLVYVNTLMIQTVLADPKWMKPMQAEDWRALTPLIWLHINPYGVFLLDMNARLTLEA